MSKHRTQKAPVTELGGACGGDLTFTNRKKANMPIITSSLRGTPARPYAELVTHIHASGGDVYVTASAAGTALEVRSPDSESVWVFLSDAETLATSEALGAQHIHTEGGSQPTSAPQPGHPTEEVRAA